MNPLLVIFCWKGDNERIERHWRTWEKMECEILLSFPVDQPCQRGGLAFNKSQHHGPEVMSRIFRTFEFVLNMRHETFYFLEADAIGLRPPPKELTNGLHGFLWDNKDPKFKASRYPHYLQGMNRETLQSFSDAVKNYDPSGEQGFQDRLIGRICEENGIPMVHRPDLTYSRNLIDTDEYFEQAQQAIDNGVCAIHGIKHQWQLDRLKLP